MAVNATDRRMLAFKTSCGLRLHIFILKYGSHHNNGEVIELSFRRASV